MRALVTTLLILACFCFGGSASVRLYEMGLSIFALACVLVFVWSSNTPKVVGPTRLLIVALVSLVAIQLLPLPIGLWNGMFQAQFSRSLPQIAQLGGMWRSLSIAPDETLYSLVAGAPAFIVLWFMASLSQSERNTIANILVLAVGCQALIGIAQAAGLFQFSMYNYHHFKVAIGLFASRNHFADFILIGTCLMFAIRQNLATMYGRALSECIFHSLIIVFLLAILSSASRSGLVLFVIALFAGYSMVIVKKFRFIFFISSIVLTVFLSAYLKFIPRTGVMKTTLARFEFTDDGRWEIWKNSFATVKSYWPWGAGLSTFRQAYEETSSVSNVSSNYINAAHNEYIQIIIEMGFLGITILFILLSIFIYSGWKSRYIPLSAFSVLGLILIMLHSIVDYPFRIISINVFISCLIAFLIKQNEVVRVRPTRVSKMD